MVLDGTKARREFCAPSFSGGESLPEPPPSSSQELRSENPLDFLGRQAANANYYMDSIPLFEEECT